MTEHRHFDVKARKEHTVLLHGSFGTASDGTIDTTVKRGRGFTVARQSAGLYRVTFDKTYPSHLSARVSIFKSAVADLAAQVQAVDLASAKTLDIQVVREGVNVAVWPKDAIDAAANTATAEHAIGHSPAAGTVRSVKYVPTAALTADNTNYATITVWKRDSAGANQTKVAEVTTQITGSGNWTAFAPVALTLQAAANIALAAGSSLTVQIAKAGSGVQVPAGTLVVEMTSKVAADLPSGELHFEVTASNTGLRNT
jgi:hypothetical protein